MSREEYRTQRELLREIEDLHRQMAAMRCDLDALTHSKPWRLYLFFANLFHFIVRFRSLQGTKRNTKKILISLKHRINRHPALKSCIMGMLSHFPRLEYRLKRLGHNQSLDAAYVPGFSPAAESIYFQLKRIDEGDDVHEDSH